MPYNLTAWVWHLCLDATFSLVLRRALCWRAVRSVPRRRWFRQAVWQPSAFLLGLSVSTRTLHVSVFGDGRRRHFLFLAQRGFFENSKYTSDDEGFKCRAWKLFFLDRVWEKTGWDSFVFLSQTGSCRHHVVLITHHCFLIPVMLSTCCSAEINMYVGL